MLMTWKGQGPLAVHDPRKSDNYKLATVIVCVPGINKLDDLVWHGTKTHPGLKDNKAFKQYIDDGLIVVERERDGNQTESEKKGEAVELAGLTAPQAVKIVENTLNMELLESWASSETRPKVRRAVEKQLKALTEFEKKEA